MEASREVRRRWPRWRELDVDGHSLRYCLLGSGPPIAVVKPHRNPPVYDLSWLLADTHTAVQIEPVGFANSARPTDVHLPGIAEQVLAVLDHEQVDDFIVWGHSLGGAMAQLVAQASPRVTAMLLNGWSPFEMPTASALRRMERELSPGGSRDAAFWRSYGTVAWREELARMPCRKLVYVGSGDRPRMQGPRGIERTRDALEHSGVDVKIFDGLDHITAAVEPMLSSVVLPEVLDWLDHP